MADTNRSVILFAGVCGLVLLALYALIVVSADDGHVTWSVDGAGLESAQAAVDRLPFVAHRVTADDIVTAPARCFDRAEAEFSAGQAPCRFDLASGPNRLSLRLEGTTCSVSVTNQREVFDQKLDSGDTDSHGELRVALDGDGARITVGTQPEAGSGQRCRAFLVDGN